jgi:hypothetical protein
MMFFAYSSARSRDFVLKSPSCRVGSSKNSEPATFSISGLHISSIIETSFSCSTSFPSRKALASLRHSSDG